MKMYINVVLSLSLLFGVLHTRFASSHSLWYAAAGPHEKSNDEPCPAGTMVVEEQTESPALLTLGEAMCDGSVSKVEVTLKNVGAKPIRSYEVVNTQDYENKKCVTSSQGVSGGELSPEQSVVLNFNGGFPSGYSYGKPVGALKKSSFKVSTIEFTDGSKWQASAEAKRTNEKSQ